VVLAKGSPLTLIHLSRVTLTRLRMEDLGRLTTGGLTLVKLQRGEDLSSLYSCPCVDWDTLLGLCTGVQRIRVTGIDREDNGTCLTSTLCRDRCRSSSLTDEQYYQTRRGFGGSVPHHLTATTLIYYTYGTVTEHSPELTIRRSE